MNVIHEFYYIVGQADFYQHYILEIEKETERQLVCRVYDATKTKYKGKATLKKSQLDQIHKFVDRKYGTFYRLYIIEEKDVDLHQKAKDIIYRHLIAVAENFYNS